jgi:hypothetical protein
MIKIASLQAIAAALLACGLAAAPAQAGPNRTWVSGHGTDSGTCALVAPCRTFAFALTATNAGGEIDVLDPAGYGPVTINKSIGIVNDGVGVAAIGAGSGNGITINAGANDSVHLRGLTIEGISGAGNGILFNSGGNLAIENCVIRGFTVVGILITPSSSSTFSVSNTIVSNNPGNFSGIFVQPTGSAVVTGVLSKVTMDNNGAGISVENNSTGALNVTIVDSEASNNVSGGIIGSGSAAHPATVMVRNVVLTNNGTGITGGSATVRVAHSVITGNRVGVTGFPTFFSYGDNDIDGNDDNNTGVITPLAMH